MFVCDLQLIQLVRSTMNMYCGMLMKFYVYVLILGDLSMNEIRFKLRSSNNKMEDPDFYLGFRINHKDLNGCSIWTMPIMDYVKLSVVNV